LFRNCIDIPLDTSRAEAVITLFISIEIPHELLEDAPHTILIVHHVVKGILCASFKGQERIKYQLTKMKKETIESIVTVELNSPEVRFRYSDFGYALQLAMQNSKFTAQLRLQRANAF
jgi:hypothetical protein